jgi:DNA-binding transcriptional ArsR family regulator
LTEASRETWERILQRGFKYPVLTARIDFSEDEVELGTNDFVFLMMEFAEEAGIDLKKFGRRLVGDGVREDRLVFYPGVALRTVFEVEGHYVEFPNAYTLYKVPKQALIVVGAALIGMAAGRANEIDPVVGGALTGVAGLLINILAARYLQLRDAEKPEVTWTEEFMLKVLEGRGEQSVRELQKHTKLYRKTIKETLDGLYEKGLVERRKVILDGKRVRTEMRYELRRRE